MSINNSYFSKNNTIVSNSYTNTGRNPVMSLFYGAVALQSPNGFSRFIFDLDLALLREKLATGVITTSCPDSIRHKLRMTNTSTFDIELLNTRYSTTRMRATSFDLILFRIPKKGEDNDIPQFWDEGVGYDFTDLQYEFSTLDKAYSVRPSNWYQTTTLQNWSNPGIYNNKIKV